MVKIRVKVTFTAIYEIYRILGDRETEMIEEEYPTYDVCNTAQMSIYREETMKINIDVENPDSELERESKAKEKIYNILMNRSDRPSSELSDICSVDTEILKMY